MFVKKLGNWASLIEFNEVSRSLPKQTQLEINFKDVIFFQNTLAI